MNIKSLVAHSNFNAFTLVGFFSCLAATPVSALVIDATFESSITGDPNAASIEGQINSAIQTIDGLYGTPITVKVSIGTDLSGFGSNVVAVSSDPLVPVPYATYVAQLTAIANADPSNTVLATALQHINDGNGAVQYGGTNKQVAITYANAQLLGLSPVHYAPDNITLLPGPPQYAATINFNSTYFSTAATPPGALQPISVTIAEHELNHALGAALSTFSHGVDLAAQYNGAIDLYRYPAGYSLGDNYFSIDGGVTKIASLTLDGHFDNSVCLIESAGVCNTTELYTTASPEYTELLALGYDPTNNSVAAATPLPSTWSMLLSGFVGLGFFAYRGTKKRSAVIAAA